MANILSIISVCGSKGGTTVKLKKLVESSIHNHFVYFALYDEESVAAYPQNKKWFCEAEKAVVFEGFFGRNIFYYTYDIIKLIKKHDIHVINFYFNFENSFAPIIKLFCPNVVLVRSIVGYDEPLSYSRQFLLNQVLKPIDYVIHISNYIKTRYETDFKILTTKPHKVIFNAGINSNNVELNLESRKSLVSISGLCKRKNLLVLIRAMWIVKNRYNHANKLYIIGDGPMRIEIENLIKSLDLAENIILVGYSNNTIQYLQDCSIYVHPADTEGFGIAVTEAMDMGCPTIVSNAGALPELVINGQTGYIVDPYDENEWANKIDTLLNDNSSRFEMSYNARKRSNETFPLSKFINQHDDLFTFLSNN